MSNKARTIARQKERRAEKKELGHCRDCSSHKAFKGGRCRKCYATSQNYLKDAKWARYRKQRKERLFKKQGLCTTCTLRKHLEGKRSCQMCLDNRRWRRLLKRIKS